MSTLHEDLLHPGPMEERRHVLRQFHRRQRLQPACVQHHQLARVCSGVVDKRQDVTVVLPSVLLPSVLLSGRQRAMAILLLRSTSTALLPIVHLSTPIALLPIVPLFTALLPFPWRVGVRS
eukprot:scaffold87907_cov60-Phaeocystis_antarctica.AAC.1